ncbi:hypothetical protein BGZ83_000121 [Gryganskiella cystojenkinii]|nr:hypothetical protein BGZ83_000121 [Gryganskiella cystojenkinii]
MLASYMLYKHVKYTMYCTGRAPLDEWAIQLNLGQYLALQQLVPEASEDQSDILEEGNEVEEVEDSHSSDDHEHQEQPIHTWPMSEKGDMDDNTTGLYHDSSARRSQDLSGEQLGTPDLYSDDDGDVDGSDGLIDLDDHSDSSEEGELNAAAAEVRNAGNPFDSGKKQKPMPVCI